MALWHCVSQTLALACHLAAINNCFFFSTLWAEIHNKSCHNAILTQLSANNFFLFWHFAKSFPVNIENYYVFLFILIKNFENRFQYFQKCLPFYGTFWYGKWKVIPFSISIQYTSALNFQFQCTEYQSDIQLQSFLMLSYWTSVSPSLPAYLAYLSSQSCLIQIIYFSLYLHLLTIIFMY